MKKKIFGLALLSFITFGIFSLKTGLTQTNFVPVMAEEIPEGEDPEEPIEPLAECTVILDKIEHATIEVDKLEGSVGEIVNVTIKNDIFYIINKVMVNETVLVESEETSGLYSFSLVLGENKITAEIILDEELFGVFGDMVKQAEDKDWSSLFSVKNVVTLISFILDGGLLIAVIRYFIKDKKLEDKLEKHVSEKMDEIIPDMTKETVLKCAEEKLEPIFASLKADNAELMRVIGVLVKCIALMQENTPESRKAIIDELANLKVGDAVILEQVKKYIEDMFKQHEEQYNQTMAQLEEITESNKAIVEGGKEEDTNKKFF